MSKPLYVRALSRDEFHQLEGMVRSENVEMRRRAQSILESAVGKTAHDIAGRMMISPENVKRWLRHFNAQGLVGIEQRKRGPEPRFTEAQVADIRALAAQSPTSLGFDFEKWSPQKLAEAARVRGIVEAISHVTVRKLLSAHSSKVQHESDEATRRAGEQEFESKARSLLQSEVRSQKSEVQAKNNRQRTADGGPPSETQNSKLKTQNSSFVIHPQPSVLNLKSRLWQGELSPNEEAAVRCALSEAYENIGQYPEALAVIESYDLPESRPVLDGFWQAQTRLRLGWGYTWQGNQPRALARMNEAFRLFLEQNNHDGVSAAHYAIGRTYVEINEFKIGRDRIWQGLKLLLAQVEAGAECKILNSELAAETGPNWRAALVARMHLSLGVIDYCEGNFEAAKKNYVRAMELATGSALDRNLLGLVAMNLALIHDQVGERRDAKRYYEQAIEDFTQGGHEGFLARCHNNLGESLTHHGLWTQAAQHLEKALALAERHQIRENEALTLITLAELRMLQGQIGVAEQHLARAIELLVDGDKWAEAYAQRVLGKVHLAAGRDGEGLSKLQLAVQMTTDIGDQHGMCLSYLELSDYHLQHANFDQAETSLEMARELLQNSSGFYASGVTQRLTGKLEAARHRYVEAQQHLLQSISIFTANDDQYEVAISRMEVGRLFLELQDYTQAQTQLRQAEELLVHLGSETAVARVRELRQKLGASPEAEPPIRSTALPPSEALLLQRLIEACGARELLLQELASILYENFAASSVVVWEADNYSPPRVLLAHTGNGDDAHRLALRGEDLLASGRRTGDARPNDEQVTPEWVRVLFERDLQRIGLYVACDPAGLKLPFKYMLSLLKQAGLGLEISSLRTAHASTSSPMPPTSLPRPNPLIPGFISSSPAMLEVVDHIRKIRTSDVTVLITGESGTGKELIARAIHVGSARRDAVFLPFNCTATPRDLVESQLFGHRRGAFTGAVSNYSGIIRAAAGGTLFLDEIGDLALETQPKLMRFLQEGEIQPLGEPKPVKVDVRVLAATNVNLERAVNEGRFREDLFHRLNIIRIHVPPLRSRREEIPLLAAHYLEHFSQRDGKHELRLLQDAVEVLVAYDWSGNVRQLRNEIERVVAFAVDGAVIGIRDLSPEISRQRTSTPAATPLMERDGLPNYQHREPVMSGTQRTNGSHMATINYPVRATLREATERLEMQLISDVLDRTTYNISRAARELGLSRRGLRLKMDQLGLGGTK